MILAGWLPDEQHTLKLWQLDQLLPPVPHRGDRETVGAANQHWHHGRAGRASGDRHGVRRGLSGPQLPAAAAVRALPPGRPFAWPRPGRMVYAW